jgi:hypothetical protein
VTATDDKIRLSPDAPPDGDVSGPHRAERAARTRARKWHPWLTRLVSGLLSGTSVVEGPWPSLAQVWERHAKAAEYYAWPLVRWLRYLWAALAITEACVLRTWEWSGWSPGKRLGLIVVVVVALWLMHVIKF